MDPVDQSTRDRNFGSPLKITCRNPHCPGNCELSSLHDIHQKLIGYEEIAFLENPKTKGKFKTKNTIFDETEFRITAKLSSKNALGNVKPNIFAQPESLKCSDEKFGDTLRTEPFRAVDERKSQTETNSENGQLNFLNTHELAQHQQPYNDGLKPIGKKIQSFSDFAFQETTGDKCQVKNSQKSHSAVRLAPPSIENLVGQKNFKVELNGNAFAISRNIPKDKWAFLVYNARLTGGELFKITITAINTSCRHLGFGFMDLIGFSDLKHKDYKYWTPAGYYHWFFGYYCLNLSGKYPAKSSADSKGFKPGDVVYLEYRPDSVAIYNDDRSIDLLCAELKASPYYMFMRFYDKETAVTLERLR